MIKLSRTIPLKCIARRILDLQEAEYIKTGISRRVWVRAGQFKELLQPVCVWPCEICGIGRGQDPVCS
jgi:hypothetical protein